MAVNDTVSINMDLAAEGERLAATFGRQGPPDIIVIHRNGRWTWDVFFDDRARDAHGTADTLDAALQNVLAAAGQ